MENFWEFFAGLGIFLYSMWLLEDALRQLAGRTFKLFLRKYTSTTFGAIASGTAATAVLQSSTIATLMTLAFVTAGAINMRNAFAVVLGANIGTTLSSWIVALIGFGISLQALSYPLMALAAPVIVFFYSRKKIYYYSRFIFSFGLLFLGLNLMKESMLGILDTFSFSEYLHYDAALFILLGFLVTAVMQSSSATMVITLSALNTGALPFTTAAAVIIGSELGTATKFYLGSATASADKKRITAGNIIFNAFITVAAYLLLPWLTDIVTNIPGIQTPLLSLVAFQTLINTAGVILFYPFLQPFGRFLDRLFTSEDLTATFFLSKANTDFIEDAAATLEKETYYFLLRVIRFNAQAFHIREPLLSLTEEEDALLNEKEKKLISFQEKYAGLKKAEGEILSFFLQTKENASLNNDDVSKRRIEQLATSIQNAMYSAKSMKDILHNRRDLRASAEEDLYNKYQSFKKQLKEFYRELNGILHVGDKTDRAERLKKLYARAEDEYDLRLREIYRVSSEGEEIFEREMASLLNLNRELFSSCKAIVRAVNDYEGNEKIN